jgi:hypothetical protein
VTVPAPEQPPPLVIRDVNVVDVTSGTVKDHQRVEVRDGRIARVVPEQGRRPDRRGSTRSRRDRTLS